MFTFPCAASWSKRKTAAALAGVTRHTQRPDLDNLLKAITDGLNSVAYGDDAQLCQIVAEKQFGTIAQTRIEVVEL
jgi:Holliday junction resolvase RusA-like endonuclease